MVNSDQPLFHTLHRAWSACVGLPAYDKQAWRDLEALVFLVERAGGERETNAALRAIDGLCVAQGGVYAP